MAERIKVDVTKHKNLGAALKIWKSKNYQVVKELKSRKEYLKPSAKRRKQKKKAIYSHKYKRDNGLE